MTKEEMYAAMGNPAGKSVNSKGLESWNYNDNLGEFQHLTVNFDADGAILRVRTSHEVAGQNQPPRGG